VVLTYPGCHGKEAVKWASVVNKESQLQETVCIKNIMQLAMKLSNNRVK